MVVELTATADERLLLADASPLAGQHVEPHVARIPAKAVAGLDERGEPVMEHLAAGDLGQPLGGRRQSIQRGHRPARVESEPGLQPASQLGHLEPDALAQVLVLAMWLVSVFALRVMLADGQIDAAAALASANPQCRTVQTLQTTTGTIDFRPGGAVRVEVGCALRLSDLGLLGLPTTRTVSATYLAPIDTSSVGFPSGS